LINTSQQIGGAVGLAILAATASVITEGRLPGDRSEALTTGYSYGLLIGGGIYLLALIVTLGTIKATAPQSQPQPH
ncbi:multidrug efflux MFS transporter, partial [Streptomyces sp. SID8455]|nr:multidrug efflux MFS transporter [Streptomyces sp. SID8455]